MSANFQSKCLESFPSFSDFEFKDMTKKIKRSKFYKIPDFKLNEQQMNKACTDKTIYNHIVRKITKSLFEHYGPFFGRKEIHSACTLVVYKYSNIQEKTCDNDAFGVDKLLVGAEQI